MLSNLSDSRRNFFFVYRLSIEFMIIIRGEKMSSEYDNEDWSETKEERDREKYKMTKREYILRSKE